VWVGFWAVRGGKLRGRGSRVKVEIKLDENRNQTMQQRVSLLIDVVVV
jgi:hypothetical protein